MKLFILFALIFTQYAFAEHSHHDHDPFAQTEENHDHAIPFTPEEENEFFDFMENKKGVFPSQNWNECTHKVTANYVGYRCARARKVSKILYKFLSQNVESCIDQAAKAIDYRIKDFHLIHKGIFGDARHSPRSLHAEGRAIDVKDIRINTYEKGWIAMNYERHGHGTFFKTFRKCWGKVVSRKNDCPLYKGTAELTASIGKENKNHQKHLHVSVPYCIGGNHAGNYFFR